ncbi:MAG: hypothetical protein Q4D57_03760 [Clostridia bacterium]|nr:hypothetical protein [Clostridia bacterium]
MVPAADKKEVIEKLVDPVLKILKDKQFFKGIKDVSVTDAKQKLEALTGYDPNGDDQHNKKLLSDLLFDQRQIRSKENDIRLAQECFKKLDGRKKYVQKCGALKVYIDVLKELIYYVTPRPVQ